MMRTGSSKQKHQDAGAGAFPVLVIHNSSTLELSNIIMTKPIESSAAFFYVARSSGVSFTAENEGNEAIAVFFAYFEVFVGPVFDGPGLQPPPPIFNWVEIGGVGRPGFHRKNVVA